MLSTVSFEKKMNKEGYTIAKEGYLLKESLYFKQLRKRWIILNKGYMDCYKDNALLDPSETLDLSMFGDVKISIEKGRHYQFELVANNGKANRIFVASSTQNMNAWIKQIKHCMIILNNNNNNTQSTKTDHKANHMHNNGVITPNKHINNNSSSKNKKTKQNGLSTSPRPIYTEKDIKNISIWYANELKTVQHQHNKEKDELLSHVKQLKNELTEIKYNHSKEMKNKMKTLSQSKEKQPLESYICKLEQDMDSKGDIDTNLIGEPPSHSQLPSQRGLLIFQTDGVTHKQLMDVTNYYQSNMGKVPKFLFGDGDSDMLQLRANNIDKRIIFAISTYFAQIPTLFGYKTLINKQFKELKACLKNGEDVIIQLPALKDTFFKFNKQMIYHQIGLKLPFSFIEYIQHKIDELTKYAYSTQIVRCYIYNKRDYKCINKILVKTERKSGKTRDKEKETRADVQWQWQWKNSRNKWISYDNKTNHAIERLAINGMYEYTMNSFIAKISKKTGIHVNINNESKREIRRIKINGREKVRIQKNDIITKKKQLKTMSVSNKKVLQRKDIIMKRKQLKAIAVTNKKKKYNFKEKSNRKYIINWQWKDDNNRWITYSPEMSNVIETLQLRECYEYVLNDKTYKITKETRNFAVEIDSETFEKRHVRQTRKEINVEHEMFICNTNVQNEEKQLKVDTEKNSNVRVNYMWQWMDNNNNNNWNEYDAAISRQIEHLKINRSYYYKHFANEQCYKISKLSQTKAVQINIRNDSAMNVRRIGDESSNAYNKNKYPAYWNHAFCTKANYCKPKLIAMGTNEKVGEIKNRFFECVDSAKYEIIKIEGIQNQMLFDKYLKEKQEFINMSAGNLNEMHLFYEISNSNEKIIKFIGKRGFKNDAFVENNKFGHGEGIYFRKNVIKNGNNCDENGIYKICECLVICGESIIGDHCYGINNWPKKESGKIYDSLVDDEWNKSVFVIHKQFHYRVYPMFIVYFRKQNQFCV